MQESRIVTCIEDTLSALGAITLTLEVTFLLSWFMDPEVREKSVKIDVKIVARMKMILNKSITSFFLSSLELINKCANSPDGEE